MLTNNTHIKVCRLFVFTCVLSLGLAAQTHEKKNSSETELPFAENEAAISLIDGQTLSVEQTGNVDGMLVKAFGFGPFEMVRFRFYRDIGTNIFDEPIATYDIRASALGKITESDFNQSEFKGFGGLVLEAHGFDSRRSLNVSVPQYADSFAPATYGELWIHKQAAPPSNQAFNFATTNLSPTTFDLIDNSISGNPKRTFFVTSGQRETYTITETVYGPYDLREVTCSYTNYGGGDPPTITRTGNTILIRMKYPEFVCCTFHNDLVTAAEVTLAGTVSTSEGRGIPRASVRLTNSQGIAKTTWTNQFGHFNFEEIEGGDTCLVEVRHKRYQFETRVVTFDDSIRNLDFYPIE